MPTCGARLDPRSWRRIVVYDTCSPWLTEMQDILLQRFKFNMWMHPNSLLFSGQLQHLIARNTIDEGFGIYPTQNKSSFYRYVHARDVNTCQPKLQAKTRSSGDIALMELYKGDYHYILYQPFSSTFPYDIAVNLSCSCSWALLANKQHPSFRLNEQWH